MGLAVPWCRMRLTTVLSHSVIKGGRGAENPRLVARRRGGLLLRRCLLGRRLVRRLLGGSALALLVLLLAAPVVGRVEARPLEVHGDGKEELLDGPGAARDARLGKRIGHSLEH